VSGTGGTRGGAGGNVAKCTAAVTTPTVDTVNKPQTLFFMLAPKVEQFCSSLTILIALNNWCKSSNFYFVFNILAFLF
jgi:hypothetical protein